MGAARLLFSKPTFRAHMLKEGMKPLAPLIFTASDWKAAGDIFGPALCINKTRSARDSLIDYPGRLILESDCRTLKI